MSKLSCRGLAVLALGLATGLVLASPASGQYFGRNKVQYRTFKYEVFKTAHFDVYFYGEGRQAAEDAGRKAERWLSRLSRVFQHRLSGTQPLILYMSHPDFEQTNVTPEEVDEGTGGFTDVFRRRIVLPLGASPADTDHVIGHELVHAFQFDITTQASSQGNIPGAIRLPLWFIEGMSEYLTIGPVDTNTAMWIRDAVGDEKLPTLKDLEDPDYFPYRWGQAFWSYVTGRWGDKVVGDLLRVAGASGDVESAISRLLEVKPDDLAKQWHQAIRETYSPVAAATRSGIDYGNVLVSSSSDFGSLNVSPALSPDGRLMAFLSQRDLFSIDLFVAEAETGKVVRKLTKTAVDPHYTSLGFLNSAGAWAPDNRRLAFSAISSGQAVIVLLDVVRNQNERELRFKDLGEIFSLSWAPDGKRLAFSAQANGVTDLYIYDFQAEKLRKLTSDGFGDLQPAWSPDGKSIAFVTDRFSTDLSLLSIGNFRIGLVDPESGQVRPLPGLDKGKNFNPQWAPDGRSLYFLSDRTGITNLYRAPLDSGEAVQLTNFYTGISGITSLSPALSVASTTGRTVYSVREKGNYDIYAYVPEKAATVVAASAPLNAGVLPPAVRVESVVAAVRADDKTGLPAPGTFKQAPYDPKLGLEGVSQPSITFGADRFGTYAGGGITLLWSDLLGDYSLATGFQVASAVSGGFSDIWKDSAVFVGFQNLKRRWNWGVSAQQVPYLSGGYSSGMQIVDGQVVGVDQAIISRQIYRDASAVVAYPFNRVQRVELLAGVRQASYELIYDSVYYDPYSGQMLGQDRTTESLGSIRYGEVSAALVFDSASYGATSPVLGQRYRLEASPTFGQIKFTNILADYRKYFMPASFYTLAVRGLHYGRYGGGSENPMLMPLYLGYPNLVRGYDYNSFDSSDCTATADSSCPEFDRLVGSRIVVGNVEFRFPLLRPFGADRNMYGPVPVEVAFFADGGVAWTAEEKPSMFGGTRKGVASAGVSFRFNAFGFLIGEFAFAKPFQRQNKGWVFQFNFGPGF